MKKKSTTHQPDRVKETMAQYITGWKNQFAVIIEQDEDGYFVASVPALPGCHTQAKTLTELRKRVKDAIKLCLEVAKKDPAYNNKVASMAYHPQFIAMEMISI